MSTDHLISAVFGRRPLWDQKDRQHHNRYILDKLRDAVAKEVKSTRESVRTKWKNLRDHFRKEFKKTPTHRSGDEGGQFDGNSTWAYFDALVFLRDQFTPRTSQGNLPTCSTQEIVIEEDQSQTEQDSIDVGDVENARPSPVSEPIEIVNENVSNIPVMNTPSAKRGIKRSRHDDIGSALVNIEREKLRIIQNEQLKTQDEDVSFFDSLLPHVRRLPSRDKMLLRMKIQELVYNFVYTETRQVQLPTNQPLLNIQHSDNRDSWQPSPSNSGQNFQDYSNSSSVVSYFSNYTDGQDI